MIISIAIPTIRPLRANFRKIIFSIVFCLFAISTIWAQQPVTPPATTNTFTEQQLENSTESSEDAETQDDSFLQSLQQYAKDPMNLNAVDEATLKELMILSPIQIQSFLSYRKLFGDLLTIYELQAVPSWDLYTIEKIRPFVKVASTETMAASLGSRLKGGTHTLVMRVNQIMETSKGFQVDPVTKQKYYPGSPQRYFMRYRYQFKNLLQYGFVAEKDAGESFFSGYQKSGFDFYSAHLFARNLGPIKALALGDFTVNFGQGLTQWQSLAFKKSPDVTNIKRQLPTLRPYSSAGEANFHRGVGITMEKNKWEWTIFASLRKMDANFAQDSGAGGDFDFVTSFQSSGLHRTAAEAADKGVQQQITYGGNLHYSNDRLKVGVNALQYKFGLPVIKSNEPYNIYALSGKSLTNVSVDYSYTYRNMHLFGELATDQDGYKALMQGLLMSVDINADLSMVYRNISPGYKSLYTNAFTESAFPVNEQGLYTGLTIRPTTQWRIDGYVDFYRFPWLRFLVDAPGTTGIDYMAQVTYRPNKQLEMYARYRYESKAKNFNYLDADRIDPVLQRPRQNFRTQLSFKVSQAITLRNRLDLVWWDRQGAGAEQGFLGYIDLIYKPMMKKLSGNLRLQYFETDGYDSRLYAFENDVLYSFSIPVFYEKGYRYYVNLNYDVSKRLTLWARVASTVYSGKTTVGSGYDAIEGNRRTEVKLQLQYLF